LFPVFYQKGRHRSRTKLVSESNRRYEVRAERAQTELQHVSVVVEGRRKADIRKVGIIVEGKKHAVIDIAQAKPALVELAGGQVVAGRPERHPVLRHFERGAGKNFLASVEEPDFRLLGVVAV